MKLFKDKKYSVIDIGLIKWSCILFGMVLGAYVADYVHIPAHPDGESGGIRTLNRDIRTPCGWI
jgi:hypothetical protein